MNEKALRFHKKNILLYFLILWVLGCELKKAPHPQAAIPLELTLIRNQKKLASYGLEEKGLFFADPGDEIQISLNKKILNVVPDHSWWDTSGRWKTIDQDLVLIAPSEPGFYSLKIDIEQKRNTYSFPLYCSVSHKIETIEADFQWKKPDPEKASRKMLLLWDKYQPPSRAHRVTEEMIGLEVLPGHPLKERFICKIHPKSEHWAQQTVIDPRILEKCHILKKILKNRYDIHGLKVFSGFRSPAYNRAVDGADFSRHVYGDAIDMIIDYDGDGRFDDLNQDGKLDREDGLIVVRTIQELERSGKVEAGGVGIYEFKQDHEHGVTLHMDTRGLQATWGYSWRSGEKVEFTW